jgi:iron complex outermembrane receptor protein
VSDADLVLGPSGFTTRTDARGFFEFRGVTPGQVELAVRRVGFTPVVVVLQVDGVETTQVDIPLEPVATVLDPIVTSVTRDQRSLSEVAAAVSVADTSAIDRGRTVGPHEQLRMMPGVQAASRHGTFDWSIGIRGSAARAAPWVRGVAVLLDGIPLTEPDGAVVLDLIEPAASRQVEVVRGPVSSLYAGAPGGVVNVVSRSGWDSRGISARALGGAFAFRKYDAQAGGVLPGGRGSGFAAASYTSADGYRVHSDGDVLRGQVAVDYVAGPGTRVAIQANGSRLDSRFPGSQSQSQFDADPDAAAPFAVTSGLRRVDHDRYRAGARLEHAIGSSLASGYILYGGRTLEVPNPFEIVDLNLHRVQTGVRLRSDRLARSGVDATIGVDYDNVFGDNRSWENDSGGVRGPLRGYGYQSNPNLGVYAELEWEATRTASVTFGFRYDWVTYQFESYVPEGIPRQETTFDHLSPRLSAMWSPDAGTSLYASLGRGVEVPNWGDLVFSPQAPLFRSVYPKSLWNYEVGARRFMGSRVLVDGSVFYADVRGEFVPETIDNVSVSENASRSRNIGIELAVTAQATPHVQLGASYTFLDLRLQDYASEVLDSTGTRQQVDFAGKLLPAVPRHRLTGEGVVRPLAAVELGVQVEWQSVVYVETGNAESGTWYFELGEGAPVQQVPFRAVPARALVHLNAAWRLGPATLFGSVENLFGLRYAGSVLANEFFGRFYEAGPPAWVSLGFRVAGWGPAP